MGALICILLSIFLILFLSVMDENYRFWNGLFDKSEKEDKCENCRVKKELESWFMPQKDWADFLFIGVIIFLMLFLVAFLCKVFWWAFHY